MDKRHQEQRRRNINLRKQRRRKRIIIAYIARTIAAVICITTLILMVCGGLFIRNLFRGNIEVASIFGLNDVEEDGQIDDLASGLRIVIDAGHGGTDSGSIVANVNEKDVNLSVAMKLQKVMEQHGAIVTLTRSGDEYVSLSDRAAIANDGDADVFISLHCNYYEDDDNISGLECYYMSRNAKVSEQYAQNIVDAVAQSDEINTRKTETVDYFVLRSTTMPAVLVEMGYLSNDAEREKLSDDTYQSLLAASIADGIMHSL